MLANMIELQAAADILKGTIQKGEKGYHKHFRRVCELAILYRQLITGENIEDLLRLITARESAEQFKLRKKLLFSIIPAVCEKIRLPFTKVPRADGMVLEVKAANDTDQEKINNSLRVFWGDESLIDYMADRFIALNFMDPNAFIAVAFDQSDVESDKIQPYPIEISSAEAINYQKTNNSIDWLISKHPHMYRDKGKPKKGERFMMYAGQIIDLKQVQHNSHYSEHIDTLEQEGFVQINKKSYSFTIYQPFGEDGEHQEIQLIQVGHKKDILTGGVTYVSVIEPAVPRMKSTLKVGSEEAITMALAAHPQVAQYVPDCEDCNDGRLMSGETCKVCKGTGKKVLSSGLDSIELPMPRDIKDLAPLSNIKAFLSPDTALVALLVQYMKDKEPQIIGDVFSTTQYEREKTTMTATEVVINSDNTSDTLYPFARKYATVFTKLARLTAIFTDTYSEDLKFPIQVPKRYNLKGEGAIIEELKLAKEAGASPAVRAEIESRLTAKQLGDRPEELTRARTREKFRPLRAFSEDMIRFAIAGGKISESDEVLYYYEDQIYRELEQDFGNFYLMAEDAQAQAIDTKVQMIISERKPVLEIESITE